LTIGQSNLLHLLINSRIEDKLYTLALFDTAGQENYDRLRPLAYQNGDVFLICCALGARAQYESTRYKWAPELKQYCPGVPAILVGVRQPAGDEDEVGQEKVPELGQEIELEYGRTIAKEIGAITYLECDILTRLGLQDVFERVCPNLPLILGYAKWDIA
jgi:small GTP-binding protein